MYKGILNAKRLCEKEVARNVNEGMIQNIYNTIASDIARVDLLEKIKHSTLYDWYRKSVYTSTMMVEGSDELHQARSLLRIALGSWEDKLIGINHHSGEFMYVHYKSERHNFSIHVVYHKDKLPDGILAPSCRIEKQKDTFNNSGTREYYSVVCEKQEEGDDDAE